MSQEQLLKTVFDATDVIAGTLDAHFHPTYREVGEPPNDSFRKLIRVAVREAVTRAFEIGKGTWFDVSVPIPEDKLPCNVLALLKPLDEGEKEFVFIWPCTVSHHAFPTEVMAWRFIELPNKQEIVGG